MKNYWISAAAVLIALGMSACERESRTVEKSSGTTGSTTVVQPKETVKEKETVVTQPTPGPTGPAGPAGATGEKGEPGKSASDSSTGTPSSESKTETKTETTETKKE